MKNPEANFPKKNPEKEGEIIDALNKGDEASFKKAGEKTVPEILPDFKDQERWAAILSAFGQGDFDFAEDLGANFDKKEQSKSFLIRDHSTMAVDWAVAMTGKSSNELQNRFNKFERDFSKDSDPVLVTFKNGSVRVGCPRELQINVWPGIIK